MLKTGECSITLGPNVILYLSGRNEKGRQKIKESEKAFVDLKSNSALLYNNGTKSSHGGLLSPNSSGVTFHCEGKGKC